MKRRIFFSSSLSRYTNEEVHVDKCITVFFISESRETSDDAAAYAELWRDVCLTREKDYRNKMVSVRAYGEKDGQSSTLREGKSRRVGSDYVSSNRGWSKGNEFQNEAIRETRAWSLYSLIINAGCARKKFTKQIRPVGAYRGIKNGNDLA